MKMLPGETILLQSNNDQLILTTHRVRYNVKEIGQEMLSSIMLEELTICQLTSTSKPLLLILAGIVFILGLAMNNSRNNESAIGGLVIALVLVIAYVGTRRGIIALRAAGGAIEAPTAGMSMDIAKQFIDAVEAAKNNRSLSRPAAMAATS